MAKGDVDQRIAAMRRFNRFYTQKIGVLSAHWAESPFSLAEARILYELMHRERPTASALARALELDQGYLSRLLKGLERGGLIARKASDSDARQQLIALTTRGKRAYAPMEARTVEATRKLLDLLSTDEQARLVAAMQTIERLIGGEADARAPYLLRMHRPGDMGWIVGAHGVLYAEEYGWDGHEALIADIVASFIKNFDDKRERCFIAERDGEIVGSAMLVKRSASVAQLRAMLVVKRARGLGIGTRLVEECLRFARAAAYKRVKLWTQSNLTAARRIYKGAGFRLVAEEPHHSFGHDLVGETWELKL